MLHYILSVAGLLYSVNLTDHLCRRCHQRRDFRLYLIGIGQRIVAAQRGKDVALLTESLPEIFNGPLLGNIFHGFQSLHFPQLIAYVLYFRLADIILQIYAYLYLRFQRISHPVRIHHDDQKHTEYEQCYRHRTDGSKGHPAVSLQGQEGLMDEVLHRIKLHSRILPVLHLGQYGRPQ